MLFETEVLSKRGPWIECSCGQRVLLMGGLRTHLRLNEVCMDKFLDGLNTFTKPIAYQHRLPEPFVFKPLFEHYDNPILK